MATAETKHGPLDEEGAPDGRARRSERSRQAMLDGLFDLVGEGILRPTAHQVAERAGVGIRTVFRHFSDMDTLFAELNDRLRTDHQYIREREPAGDLEQRARDLVGAHCDLFERVAPYRRSADLGRLKSAYLQQAHRRQLSDLRAWLEQWLPEVKQGDSDLADALDVAMSFETWNRLRTDQGLGAKRARDTIERIVLSLVSQL